GENTATRGDEKAGQRPALPRFGSGEKSRATREKLSAARRSLTALGSHETRLVERQRRPRRAQEGAARFHGQDAGGCDLPAGGEGAAGGRGAHRVAARLRG